MDEAALAGTDPSTLVALSVLQLSGDSRAARWVHTLEGALPADPLQALASHLRIPESERPARIVQARTRAERALRRAADNGIAPLPLTDPRYPSRLKQIFDPPIVLWAQGDPATLERPAVAVVGSRNATPGGLVNARRLGMDLAAAGLLVVSGLARGIDGAAHQGALAAGGATAAVLGSGADVIYPHEHEPLAREVARGGVILSEYPPGTPPFARNFPLRNRVISGLSLGVVVVEASRRSGSLITARCALEQGRDVLAVPGGVGSGCYRGCHALIKDGARLVETVEDILEELRFGRSPAVVESNSQPVNELQCEIRSGETTTAEELAVRTGRPVGLVLADLGRLEVEGVVVRMPGGQFARLDGPVTNRDRGRT
jgi:DNA processing protein